VREASKPRNGTAGILQRIFRFLLTPAVLLGTGIVVGVLSSKMPLLLTVTAFGGMLAFWLTCLRPDLALTLFFCGVVMLTDGVPEGSADYFSIPDMDIVQGLPSALTTFLLFLFCVVMVRTVFFEKRSLPVSPAWLGVYMGILLLALLTGIFRDGDRVLLRRDFMNMFFPVLCFYLCTTLLNSRKRIERLLTALLVVAALKAVILAAFYLAGRGWPYGGYRVATLDSSDLLVFITLALIVVHLLVRGDISGFRATAAVAASAPLLFVILFAFRRSQWGGMILSMGLLYLGAEKMVRRRIAILLVLALCAAGAVAVATGLSEEKAARITSRFTSIFDKKQSSNQYHLLESQQVLRDLSKSPLSGLGLGSRHSPLGIYEEDTVPTNVVHNTFLYIWMKIGLPGLAFFIWAAVLYGNRILRFRKHHLHDKAWGLLLPLAASSGVWLTSFLTGPVPWYFHETFLLALFAAMGTSLVLQTDSGLKPQPEVPA